MQFSTHSSSSNIRFQSTVLIFIMILLYVGTLNAIGTSKVGLIALALSVAASGLNFIYTIIKTKEFKVAHLVVLFVSFLYLIIAIFSGRDGSFIKELINPVQYLACVVVLCSFSFSKMKISIMNKLFWVSTLFIIFHFVIWLLQGLPSQFKSIYPSSNLVGPYMFIALYFILLKLLGTKKKIFASVILFLGIMVLLASDTRSVLLSMFIGFLVFVFWKFISKNFMTGTVFFGTFMTFIFLVIFLYPSLPKWRYYSVVETWMRDHTGKSLMSGRAEIWSLLNNHLSLKPYFGYGPSTVASDLIGMQASSHNLYMNIALQVGIIGLIIFILLLYFIFIMMITKNKTVISRLSSAFFIAILTHQIFEITLIQNQLSIGLFQWAIIGIGLSPLLSVRKPETKQQM
ncbi:O-antigen ligase family protein [Staphylococcus simulans]|uniref:O-antigen ligase family protein n=1 Tax=Staphylococcus simulans TaxID=1286 RepID=UPI0021D0F67B|nr:O-antigen ligase family protein [Staphylococcus simulans]UXR34455.1 O-antigen ligase family protein [Staphylococcus simulans]